MDLSTTPAPSGRARAVAIGVGAAAAVLGLLLGARMVHADRLTARAETSADPLEVVRQAADWAPEDPSLQALYAKVALQDSLVYPERNLGPEALAAARRAVDADPADARAWVDLARARRLYAPGSRSERLDRARDALLRSYRLAPWSAATLTHLHLVDDERGYQDGMDRWAAKLCALDRCPPDS